MFLVVELKPNKGDACAYPPDQRGQVLQSKAIKVGGNSNSGKNQRWPQSHCPYQTHGERAIQAFGLSCPPRIELIY